MSKTDQIREEINRKIIAALERGDMPFWYRPWNKAGNSNGLGYHHNFISKRAYRGVNPLLLEMTAMDRGFSSNSWGTFNQWNKFDCHVRKGEKSTMVVLWKPIIDQEDENKRMKGVYLKYFYVFNAQQVEGRSEVAKQILSRYLPKPEESLPADYALAEQIVAACVKDGAKIRHRGDRAFWTNDTENITVPPRDSFKTPSHYFETLFHEMSHWTELKRHTNWDRVKHGYAMGELRAELSCCYLMNHANVPHAQDLDNHTAYIKSWLEKMKGDNQWIFKACRFADEAANCILKIAGMNGSGSEEESADKEKTPHKSKRGKPIAQAA